MSDFMKAIKKEMLKYWVHGKTASVFPDVALCLAPDLGFLVAPDGRHN